MACEYRQRQRVQYREYRDGWLLYRLGDAQVTAEEAMLNFQMATIYEQFLQVRPNVRSNVPCQTVPWLCAGGKTPPSTEVDCIGIT